MKKLRKAILLIFRLFYHYLISIVSNEKTNVVLLFFQNPNIGGGTAYLFMIAELLQKRGKKIVLLAKDSEITPEIAQYCEAQNISIRAYHNEIAYMASDSFFISSHFFKFTYNYIKQVDFLLQHYNQVKPNSVFVFSGWPFMWFKALWLPGIVVFSQHVMPLHDMDKGNRLFLKLAMLFSNNIMITVSEFSKKKIEKHWKKIADKQHKVIYNYYEKNKDVKKQKHNTINILCLARVEEGKNPLLWAEIANQLTAKYKHIMFTWAGNGSLLNQAKAITLHNNRVNFIGFVKNVDELYAQTDIYFEPSKREAHGISVVGAMAWGIPAIATDNGGTTESVLDGQTGFIVDVTNKQQMIEKLEILISNSELRKTMGEKARKRYEEMFTREIWEREMDKLIKN